jgi:transcriptional regulator with XRE-family HTH domain
MKVEILVKEIRKKQGKTLSDLSYKSGVSITHISDIENDVRKPSLYVMIKLANALQVKITDLYHVKW